MQPWATPERPDKFSSVSFSDIPIISEGKILKDLDSSKSARKSDFPAGTFTGRENYPKYSWFYLIKSAVFVFGLFFTSCKCPCFPAKVLKHFSAKISKPLTKIINNCIQQGVWPEVQKCSNLKLFFLSQRKLYPRTEMTWETLVGWWTWIRWWRNLCVHWLWRTWGALWISLSLLISLGSQHNTTLSSSLRILSVIDISSKGKFVAVLATMIDWRKAFPKLDHKFWG